MSPSACWSKSATRQTPAIDYLFHEEHTPLPDLGGIEAALFKRTRHRRALLRMLYDYYQSDRMLICLDPSAIELMHDFHADRCTTRFLHIECNFSDDYLVGHAQRVGLAGERTPKSALNNLLPTIRNDITYEADSIRDAGFDHLSQLNENATTEQNAAQLARFLSVPQQQATEILRVDHLFCD
jgi:hypothetical protein